MKDTIDIVRLCQSHTVNEMNNHQDHMMATMENYNNLLIGTLEYDLSDRIKAT